MSWRRYKTIVFGRQRTLPGGDWEATNRKVIEGRDLEGISSVGLSSDIGVDNSLHQIPFDKQTFDLGPGEMVQDSAAM